MLNERFGGLSILRDKLRKRQRGQGLGLNKILAKQLRVNLLPRRKLVEKEKTKIVGHTSLKRPD